MNPFDDLLPEEQEPQYAELITLLQRAYRRPVLVPPAEQAQILARVRERLVQADQGDSLNGDISLPQIGVLDSAPHQAVSPAGKPRRDRRHFRLMALLAAAMIIAVLLGPPLLLSRSINHPEPNPAPQVGLSRPTGSTPTLTLSQNVTSSGSTIQVALKNFTPSTRIALTHDIQEPLHLDGDSSILTVGPAGSANVDVSIDSDWETGFHLLVAEDLTTRYTASATLLIAGSGPTPPPHLQLATTTLDVGAAVAGANTIRTFKLANTGGGSITWSASSKQAWLLVSPSQGTFSSSQTISIAVQRAGLQPGDYRGDLAISSNVGPPQHVEVDMSVQPVPAGPVLALSPALLSFTATDGQANPSPQTLTINNPGTRPLAWSLASPDQATATAQLSLLRALGPAGNWLSATPASGVVAPGASATLQVVVRSQSLLPGAYTGTLLFTGVGAVDNPQAVNVSLMVVPYCGVVTSSGLLSFTAVQGQSNPGRQALSLNATVSCSGEAIGWKISGAPSWVAVTPASGQLRGTTSAVVSVSVNTAGLSPNTYSGQLSFVTGTSTQTVTVELVVQPPPPPAEPVMGVSPLSLNFSNTQGLPNPTGQVVTITNTGGSPLKWSTSITLIGASGWWSALPTGGTIAPGQTGQVTITVNTSKLTPGTYTGQVTLVGLDTHGNGAPGSPQTITVNLVVQPPCALLPPSSSALSFSAVQGASTNPPSQTIVFMGIGNCVWPATWSTSVSSAASWLTISNLTNSLMGAGQSGSIVVLVNVSGLSAGTYQRTVSISATDASGAPVQGSPQTFTVTLTILPPCTLSSQASLAFTVAQGQTATAQHVAVHETRTCARPVSWTAAADQSWLVLSAASGTDNGKLSVGATSASLLPGTYSGTITITATDSASVPLVGSPQSIPVTLTVTGFAVSGSVVVCSGPAPSCTASQPLPGAAVSLMSGSTTVATATADVSGNYTFANVALGSYTLAAIGTDSTGTHTGSVPVSVQGDTPGVIIQTF